MRRTAHQGTTANRGPDPCPLPNEFVALRQAIASQHRAVLTWYIGTGCRRGETQALDWADVDLLGARARLWADTTKAGKSRVVMLPPTVVAALAALGQRAGPVFGNVDVRKAWQTACRVAAIKMRGVHDLRHAWASWHYAIHRDLLALKAAGGWASVGQVERYAHIMPAGHEAAIRALWGLAEVRPQRKRA